MKWQTKAANELIKFANKIKQGQVELSNFDKLNETYEIPTGSKDDWIPKTLLTGVVYLTLKFKPIKTMKKRKAKP